MNIYIYSSSTANHITQSTMPTSKKFCTCSSKTCSDKVVLSYSVASAEPVAYVPNHDIVNRTHKLP